MSWRRFSIRSRFRVAGCCSGPLFLLFLLLHSPTVQAQKAVTDGQPQEKQDPQKNLFVSSEDGKFDISGFLSQKYGFMPMPIMITEPAIGYGGGLNLMFLHDSLGQTLEEKSPPSISGVAGGGTENGTLAGLGYHLGFWKEDSIRTVTAAGAANINADFYLKDQAEDINIKTWFLYQEGMFRLQQTDFFLGANYLYADLETKRNNNETLNLDEYYTAEGSLSALGLLLQYDTRDSIFTPSSGMFARATARYFANGFGSKRDFQRYSGKLFSYFSVSSTVNLGFRVEAESVSGDRVPFFSYPFIMLRGIPSMRYQGEHMILAETELRWEFIPRWNLVFFLGAGRVFGDQFQFEEEQGVVEYNDSLGEAESHPAGGMGFRYELARKYGLWAGLDFATSEARDFSFYITVGSAWLAF